MVETQLRLCGHLCDLSQAEFQELQLVDGLKFLKILGEWMQPREEKPEAALPPAIVGLDVPVNIQGVEVSELRMRSPQVKDAYQYRGVFNPQDQEKMVVTQLRLCAHLCDVSQAEFKELDLADGLKFVAIFGEWMESPEGKAAASLVQGS